MNTEYCIKCGGKAEFSVSKPKFCPTCGSPFNRAASSVSKASFNEDEEEYEDDASEYVDVQSLKRKNIFKAEVNKDLKVTQKRKFWYFFLQIFSIHLNLFH